MPWTDLLDAGRIALIEAPVDREQVLEAAARLLAGRARGHAGALAEALKQRERLASTAIGHGVAIPHARGDGPQAHGAFLRLARPVDFGARDGVPVDLVFAMTTLDDRPELHLAHLAGVAERLADPEFRERLRAAPDLERLRALLLPPTSAASAA